jgi:hypothetical protein
MTTATPRSMAVRVFADRLVRGVVDQDIDAVERLGDRGVDRDVEVFEPKAIPRSAPPPSATRRNAASDLGLEDGADSARPAHPVAPAIQTLITLVEPRFE